MTTARSTPPDVRTLAQLRASGYSIRSVKDEMRANLIAMLRNGEDPFPGILGFDDTVIPAIQNAILGRHDFILLGLRGQAKSRIIRMLPSLLDEYIPVVAGSDLNDDPFNPISKYARDLLAEKGYDPHYGARPLKRVIQRLLQDPLAMRILEGDFPEGSKVTVDARLSGDALEFRKA